LVQDDVIALGERNLLLRNIPGHTDGCLTYAPDDRSMAFTGDCLLIRGSGRTDFQGGNPHSMHRLVQGQIFTLPDDCLLYPAHDYRGLTITSVHEERRFNPRLGGEGGEIDFTGYMKNLRPAHPKKPEVAGPADLQCGQPEGEGEVDPIPARDRAPLRRSFADLAISPAACCARPPKPARPKAAARSSALPNIRSDRCRFLARRRGSGATLFRR
jgi:hypothetical protein